MFIATRKIFPIKKIAEDSYDFAPAVLYKTQLFYGPTLLKNCRNHFLINLCSLASADSSKLSRSRRKTGEKNCKSENAYETTESYTASYLINSCGLSPENAITVSRKVGFLSPLKPDYVLNTLKNYGFSKTQIANLVRIKPRILLSKEKSLLPKLEFFRSIGFPEDKFAVAISRDPTLLNRSLENQIIPSYNFFKSVLLTDQRVCTAMRRSLWIFLEDPKKKVAPNIAALRKLGVPEPCIRLLLTHYPETFTRKTDKFEESVKKVLEMGFNPLRTMFVLAIHIISGSRTTWNRCFETYSSWGWSNDDIYSSFRKHPNCMNLSQKKISSIMDFFVNKMGWDSRMILPCPAVLFFSLENRIVPRCSVIQVLLSRGLLAHEVRISTFLLRSEARFVKRYVTKYEKEVPELYDIFKGNKSIVSNCDI